MEKLDQQINEARRLYELALRDASSMRLIEDARKYLHTLEEQKRSLDRSTFGSYDVGDLFVKRPRAHAIIKDFEREYMGTFERKDKAMHMDDLADAARYAVRGLPNVGDSFRFPGMAVDWHARPPEGFRPHKSDLTLMTAAGRCVVQTFDRLAGTIVYEIEHQDRDWYSNPIQLRGQSLTAIYQMSEDVMRDTMRQVTGVIVHPAVFGELMKASGANRNMHVFPNDGMRDDQILFQSPDGKALGRIKNIEPPPTVFLQELDKIK